MAECIKEDVIQRLKKIEGQVKGIQRMVETEKYCVDVLIQIAAVRAAINKVGILIFENHTRECLKKAREEKQEERMIDELINLMIKFTK
ncbi:MAG: metal-sensitive transcriptional regulator [Bacillota bacterium]|nr:metal-sensitive transcriptional regulator [Clostridia bacterium]